MIYLSEYDAAQVCHGRAISFWHGCTFPVKNEIKKGGQHAEGGNGKNNGKNDAKKVKGNLQTRIQSLNMEDYIFQIEVPEEEVKELKNGAFKMVKRNIYPGYVLVRMDLTDES